MLLNQHPYLFTSLCIITRIHEFCKWDLGISLDAGFRLELEFQVWNEFAGL